MAPFEREHQLAGDDHQDKMAPFEGKHQLA